MESLNFLLILLLKSDNQNLKKIPENLKKKKKKESYINIFRRNDNRSS